MKVWKFVALFACPMVIFVSCSLKNKQCFWVIDAVEKDNLLKVASKIVYNGQYLLRIRIKCNEMVRARIICFLDLSLLNSVKLKLMLISSLLVHEKLCASKIKLAFHPILRGTGFYAQYISASRLLIPVLSCKLF